MHSAERVGDDSNDSGDHVYGDRHDHCDYNDDDEDAEADICTWLRQLVPAPFTSYLLATLHHQSTRAPQHQSTSNHPQGSRAGSGVKITSTRPLIEHKYKHEECSLSMHLQIRHMPTKWKHECSFSN